MPCEKTLRVSFGLFWMVMSEAWEKPDNASPAIEGFLFLKNYSLGRRYRLCPRSRCEGAAAVSKGIAPKDKSDHLR